MPLFLIWFSVFNLGKIFSFSEEENMGNCKVF